MSEQRCAICGLDLRRYLVQCRECGQWFCNQKHDGKSDAYVHIQKSHHRSFYFPFNNIGVSKPECVSCGKTDCTKLCIVSQNDGGRVVFCRDGCLDKFDSPVEQTNFIKDKAFVSLLVGQPTPEVIAQCQKNDATVGAVDTDADADARLRQEV